MRVGDYLKQLRESKNVSIDAISHKTKINIKSLEALENNQFETLPSKIYIIAYVKNYCKSIQESHQKAIELLMTELEPEELSTENLVENSEISLNKEHSPSKAGEIAFLLIQKISNKKFIFSVAGIILLISLTFKIKSIVDKQLPSIPEEVSESSDQPSDSVNDSEITTSEKEKLTEVIAEETKVAEVVSQNKPKELPEKATEPTKITEVKKVEEAPAPEKVAVKEDDNIDEDKESDNDDQSERKYKPIRNAMYILDSGASEVNDIDIYPAEYKSQYDSTKQNVFINALFEDVWYRYQLDNGPVKQNTIKQGKKVFLQADDTILIFLGNFFATKVIYNNSLVTGKAPAGVKSLVFPHEKRTEHYLPLFAKDKDGNSISAKAYMETKSN